MKSPAQIAAIVCSLLLHGVVIAFVISALSAPSEKPAERIPFIAEFVVTPPPAALPVVADSPPAKKAPPQAPTARTPTPHPVSTPTHEAATAPSVAAEPQRDSPPVAAANVPATPVALPVPPTPPAPTARTGVSISASYAASNRKPVYPTLSKRYGEQGTVMLRVFVQADGSAGKIEIRGSSGYPLLDEAAQTAVQAWRFMPATVDGRAIAEWYQVPIPFTLQN